MKPVNQTKKNINNCTVHPIRTKANVCECVCVCVTVEFPVYLPCQSPSISISLDLNAALWPHPKHIIQKVLCPFWFWYEIWLLMIDTRACQSNGQNCVALSFSSCHGPLLLGSVTESSQASTPHPSVNPPPFLFALFRATKYRRELINYRNLELVSFVFRVFI